MHEYMEEDELILENKENCKVLGEAAVKLLETKKMTGSERIEMTALAAYYNNKYALLILDELI